MISSEQVNKITERECLYQWDKWGEPEEFHSVGEFTLIIGEYADKARAAWVNNAGDLAALQQIIKLGALAKNCLMLHAPEGIKPR
jgi:hypothetical protein